MPLSAGTTKNGSVRDSYTAITQAIPRVATGGKIMVAPGTYTGNITINKKASVSFLPEEHP